MSDLTKLKEILENQAKRGIKSGDWKRLDYRSDFDTDDGWTLRIDSLQVGFQFSKHGRLIGMWNWKD